MFFFVVKSKRVFFGGVNNFKMQSVHCLHFLPWKTTLEDVGGCGSYHLKSYAAMSHFPPSWRSLIKKPPISGSCSWKKTHGCQGKRGQRFPMNVQQICWLRVKVTKSEAFEFPKDCARQLLVSAVLGS